MYFNTFNLKLNCSLLFKIAKIFETGRGIRSLSTECFKIKQLQSGKWSAIKNKIEIKSYKKDIEYDESNKGLISLHNRCTSCVLIDTRLMSLKNCV